ncbi:hypothetical protein TSUD_12800 [Trifolium subterraneum]|uniref:Uncharacterized protein n=1 Tax=Trifolium subterraneum TaxID=3900 RepID=A0A2Z6P468_TRISU|nr:hypothetical protein TSUD_12800 [Trifolium subterraneum]
MEANRNKAGSGEKAMKCTKTKDANKRSCTNSHPDENPNFTLKLSRSHVEVLLELVKRESVWSFRKKDMDGLHKLKIMNTKT